MAQGVTVATRNINLDILESLGPRHFLDDINFLAYPGEMTAIMGPSGCGKTTFLNVLSKRQSHSAVISGDIYYGGRSDRMARINDFTAYVMQEDYFLQWLTVRETICFAARLRLSHLSYNEQILRADSVISELGLDVCSDVYIGGIDVKGVSGGQRKRVSIAIALLDEPQVLFLDEPTSGLDAALAFDVIQTLHIVAKNKKRTVVCTIHQPRSEVYAFFDRLLLMRLGQVVFHGRREEALEYFNSLGHQCPDDYNPSDFFIDLLTEASGTAEEKPLNIDVVDYKHARIMITSDVADRFGALFKSSQQNKKIIEEIEITRQNEELIMIDEHKSKGQIFMAFWNDTWILVLRGLRESSRKPQFLYVNFFQVFFLGAMVSSIWFKVAKPEIPSETCNVTVTRNAFGALMQIVSNVAFTSFDAGMLHIQRRPLVNREAASGLYSRSSSMVANWISDGCFHYTFTVVYLFIVYWFFDLRHHFGAYVKFLFVCWLLKFSFWGSSTAVGALAPNVTAGMGLLPLTNVLLFLVSGYQIQDNAEPGWLIWVRAISPIRYAFQILARDQFDYTNSGYVEMCMGFRTSPSFGANIVIMILIASIARFLGLLFSETLHKNQGVQA